MIRRTIRGHLLRSRFVNVLNVAGGMSRSWPASGGRVKYRYASGVDFTCGLASDPVSFA
jgi:hypothetical protein